MSYRWKVLEKQTILQHPFLTIEMEKVCLPDSRVIPDWPMVYMREYANAFVLNEIGEVLVFEGYRHGPGKSGWQVVGGYIESGESPLEAIQRELLEETGLHSDQWEHLGSYVFDANRNGGMGHFFIARNAKLVTKAQNDDNEKYITKWVSLAEIESALFNGHFLTLTYAVSIALGLINLIRDNSGVRFDEK